MLICVSGKLSLNNTKITRSLTFVIENLKGLPLPEWTDTVFPDFLNKWFDLFFSPRPKHINHHLCLLEAVYGNLQSLCLIPSYELRPTLQKDRGLYFTKRRYFLASNLYIINQRSVIISLEKVVYKGIDSML